MITSQEPRDWGGSTKPPRVELQFRELQLMPALSEGDRALMRYQSGSGAVVAFSTTPCTPLTRLEPQLFRMPLLRRFRLPFPFSRRSVGIFDALGHHRAACALAGVLAGLHPLLASVEKQGAE